MKTSSADEKTAYYFFFVLDKIKEGINLQTEPNKTVIYSVILHPALNDPYKPNSITEQKIINMLIKEGTIEEVEEKSDFQIPDEISNNPKSAGFHYYLKVSSSKFDILYQKFKLLVKELKTAESNGNTLTFYDNGKVIYVSPQGKEYTASFGRKTNSYEILYFLTKYPYQLFTFDELAKQLRSKRLGAEDSSDERRVRDTIQAIKNKLGYHGDDLFISSYGFSLNCNVSLRK